MIEHGDQGSFGLVINHPSPIKATELLESLEMSWCGEDSAVVWAGGPVSPSTGWVLHEPVGSAQPGQGTIEITSTIPLSTSPDRAARDRHCASAQRAPAPRLLGLGAGTARTGDGARAWLHTSADPRLVFETPPDRMWEAAMSSLGIDPRDLFISRGVN